MSHWNELPNEIRVIILREFCVSIISEYEQFDSHFQDRENWMHVLQGGRIHTPLQLFLNATLTCRDFNHIITEQIKLGEHHWTAPFTLQELQYSKLIQYAQGTETLDVDDEIFRASAMLGCFWSNPLVLKMHEFETFDKILKRIGPFGDVPLICQLEKVLEKCKEKYVGPETIEVPIRNKHGQARSLIFTGLTDSVHGENYAFHTVSDFKLVEPLGDQISGNNDRSKFVKLEEELEADVLPRDIKDSEPGTWWLQRRLLRWEFDWCLVNFREKRVYIGVFGRQAEWPEFLCLEKGHLWNRFDLAEEYLNEARTRCAQLDAGLRLMHLTALSAG